MLATIYGNCPIIASSMGGDILFEEQPCILVMNRLLSLEIFRLSNVITAKSQFLLDAIREYGSFSSANGSSVLGCITAEISP